MTDMTFYLDDGGESLRAAMAEVGPDTPVIFMPEDAAVGDKVTVSTVEQVFGPYVEGEPYTLNPLCATPDRPYRFQITAVED